MTQLIFVIDPMCSWCWGFHPVIQELINQHQNRFKLSLVVGGLRTKGDMSWNRESRRYLALNWRAVESRTNQAFNFSLLDREDFEYDTYPACRAVVTVRELWGDGASFDYLAKIQKAFYIENIDITKVDNLLKYIDNRDEFIKFFNSKRAEILMKHDFSKARSMGANSFPSVVKIDKDGHMMCEKGYKTLDKILEF